MFSTPVIIRIGFAGQLRPMGNGTRLFQPLGSTGRKDSSIIHANFHNIGGRRRSKFVSVDWDEGFDFDSIVGRDATAPLRQPKKAGFPNHEKRQDPLC